jgi:hypothetical protein
MLKLKSSVCALALGVGLAGCAQHVWAPGPSQKAENFDQASGQCKMVAMGANSGGGFAYAQGSPQFVGSYLGAVTVAGAIGGAVREQNAYNACMEANGFVVADNGTTGNPGAVQIVAQGKAIKEQSRACIRAVRDKPIYAPLKPHLIDLAALRYTEAQLADMSTPTASEGQLLTQLHSELAQCQNQYIADMTRLVPAAGPLLNEVKAEGDTVSTLLGNRQITWGAGAQRIQQTADDVQDKLLHKLTGGTA